MKNGRAIIRQARKQPAPTGAWVLCALLLVALNGGLGAQEPPDDLHLVADHWTAWNPPPHGPEDRVHVVQSGDTLWDLAQQFLGDGFLWPQIWEQNQYILDAHWIYPGDPLLITGLANFQGYEDAGQVVGAPLDEAGAGGDLYDTADTGVEETAMADPELTFNGAGGRDAPVPLGFESDIYCSGYIGEMEEAFPYRISGSEYEFLTPSLNPQGDSEIQGLWGKADTQKYGLGLSDIVYLAEGKADGLSAGEILTAVLPSETVEHPVRGGSLGRFYKYLGRIRILTAQEDTSIGEIVHSCDPIPVGAALKIFEPVPVPLRRITPMRPANYPPRPEELEGSPLIVYTKDKIVSLGEGHLIFVDQGADQDVAPGDIFTIYRRGRRGLPAIVVGEMGVLSVSKNTALGRILRSRFTVFVGDELLLK